MSSESLIRKPSGYKNHNETFWINERSVYGCRYCCKRCGKETKGIDFSGVGMHWTTCKHFVPRNDSMGRPLILPTTPPKSEEG